MDGKRFESSKLIAIIALVISIIGLSIGFSAFSNTLIIKSSAEVTPNMSTFDVNFSTVNTEETAGIVTASSTLGENATIDNTDEPTITGLKANFTEPGQSVSYSFYAHNNGKYKAFLNSIVYSNVLNANETKVCTAGTDTSEALVTEACKGISVSVKVGSESATTGSVPSISNHELDIDDYESIVVTITYAENSEIADGDFTVEFGDISLLYETVD